MVAAGVISLGAAGLTALGLEGGLFAGYQRAAVDSLQPGAVLDERLVLVSIDRESVNEVGMPYPWPRALQAEIIEEAFAAGAEVVAVDMVFADATPDDELLARAVSAGPTVLAAAIKAGTPARGRLIQVEHLELSVPPVGAGAVATGHAGVVVDSADGVVRSVPLVVETPEGTMLPALSLAVFQQVVGAEGPPILRSNGVQVDGHLVPTDARGILTVNFADQLEDRGAGLPTISAASVLDGELEPGALSGQIVFIGVTEPTLGDNHRTPLDSGIGSPGVVVQVGALNTMLTGAYLTPVSTFETVVWGALVALGVGMAVLGLRVRFGLLIGVLAIVLYVAVAFARFDDGAVMHLVWPPAVGMLAFVSALVVRYFTEVRHRRRVASLFAQYVPEPVAATLLTEDLVDQAAGGQRLHVAVLFCDIRGFVPLVSRIDPPRIRELLDTYYDRVAGVILDCGGTVMQFVGDEVFAVFGAPIADDEPEVRAVACAGRLQASMSDLAADLRTVDLPEVGYGIGVHSGEVVAAHLGGGGRRQYGVVGDTVNIGSRLCAVAGSGEVVVSGAVIDALRRLAALDDLEAEELAGVELKGVEPGVRAFRLANRSDSIGVLPRKHS